MKKYIAVIILILLLVIMMWVGTESNKAIQTETAFLTEERYIKEMSIDLGVHGEASGGFLLVAGSFYGAIDTQRVLTVLYSVNDNGVTVYKPLILSLKDIEIVTVSKGTNPYFKILKYYDIYGGYKNPRIEKIRLFLPEGWTILPPK